MSAPMELCVNGDALVEAAAHAVASGSGDAADVAGRRGLSLRQLQDLVQQLHAQGKSLHSLLSLDGAAGSLQLGLRSVAPSVTEGKAEGKRETETEATLERKDKTRVERQAYLQQRREFLQAQQEKRRYSELVGSVRKAELATADRESFSTFTQQGSLGLNFFVSVLTAGACGYYLGIAWFGPGEMPWMLAGVFGVIMLLVDAVIIIMRLSARDREEERRKQRPAQPMGPLGVEAASRSTRDPVLVKEPEAPTEVELSESHDSTTTRRRRRHREQE